jgi:hypothetical protein
MLQAGRSQVRYHMRSWDFSIDLILPAVLWPSGSAYGTSVGIAKKAVRDWTNRNHKEYWESVTGLTQAKGLIRGTSAKRTKDLLRLNRDQLRWMVGPLTGHCDLKGHHFKL